MYLHLIYNSTQGIYPNIISFIINHNSISSAFCCFLSVQKYEKPSFIPSEGADF